jgi:hypothetical protein
LVPSFFEPGDIPHPLAAEDRWDIPPTGLSGDQKGKGHQKKFPSLRGESPFYLVLILPRNFPSSPPQPFGIPGIWTPEGYPFVSMSGLIYCFQAPPNSGSQNFNYKKTYSVVLLALVDANYNFLYVDVGGQGRLSDAGLFDRSDLNQVIESGRLGLPRDLKLPGMPDINKVEHH